MRFISITFTLLFIFHLHLTAQGNFITLSSGEWKSKSTWKLVSGSDPNGVPDANDNVIIEPGHTVTISGNEDANNLIFNGGTIAFNSNRTLTLNGDVTMMASSSITGYSNSHVFKVLGNLEVSREKKLTVGAIKFEIQGTSTIRGDLEISGYGAKPRDFGDLTIFSGGSMKVAGQDLYTFNGSVTNNGTFSATDQTEFRFTKNGGTIGGTGNMNMYKVVFNTPASYTNNGDLTVRSTMSGTGSFTNGAGGKLELQNGGPFTVSTFNASATGNTITYTGYGNPTSFSGDYYNLILNKSSGSLSFGSSLSVLNNLTVKSGILQVNAVTLSIGNNLIIEGGEFTPDNASAVVNIGGDFIGTGGQYDHNNGDVNVTGAVSITGTEFLFSGASSTLDAGSISLTNSALTLGSGTITTVGNFTLAGTSALTANGATINVGGLFSLVNGTANFSAGNFSAGAIAVASGKELIIGNVPTLVAGAVTLNGTLTFNSSGSTKTVGSILVNSGGTWAVTQPNNFTVSGNITNNGSFTSPSYGSSIYTLTNTSGTIGGTGSLSLRDILINSPASYTNNSPDLIVGASLNGTGTFINGAGAKLTYQGDNSGGSNFTIANFNASATGNTVVYGASSSSQQWKASTGANKDYYNVTLNFTGTGDYQRLQMVSNIRVNGTLNIIAGDPVLNTYNLELAAGASITGGNATDYIRQNSSGLIRKYYSSTGGLLYLPMGDGTNYSPITNFTLSAGTLGANPYINFSVTDAVHPNRNTDNTAAGGDDIGTAAVAYLSRYWTVSGNDITSPQFSASYQYIQADVVGTESDLVATLRRHKGSVLDWKNAGTVNPTTNTVSMDSGDGFGDLYAMDDQMTRLPIVLLSFKASPAIGAVNLKWVTAIEENNQFFTIERSADGKKFEPILYVDGAGTTETFRTYTATDLFPIHGRSYYRLKQTDFNGQFEYSEVISVAFGGNNVFDFGMKGNLIEAGERLRVWYQNASERPRLVVRNLKGEMLVDRELMAEITEIDETGTLPSGIYLLTVMHFGKMETKKFIIR
ncbi:beta strand repeat-containing protein [Roseivirga echinicomitans]